MKRAALKLIEINLLESGRQRKTCSCLSSSPLMISHNVLLVHFTEPKNVPVVHSLFMNESALPVSKLA